MPNAIHHAQRAIILAAGKGERLFPVTQQIPKPLVKVHGIAMIESAITTLRDHGIKEIYVVVGYLKDQFLDLEQRYPGLTLIDNPYYESCNNISSLYVARAHLHNVIIMDADQLIQNPAVLLPSFNQSSYCCFWQDNHHTTEWILERDEKRVTHCHRSGGRSGWQLQSVSFWSAEDGKKLQEDLQEVFINQGRKDLYWDDLALNVNPTRYDLGIRSIAPGDIVEIDSYAELLAWDDSYASSDLASSRQISPFPYLKNPTGLGV